VSDQSEDAANDPDSRSFAGAGKWLGAAEVYDGLGRFKGNGQDTRHVQLDIEPGVTEVEVSFVGPFKMSGTYRIADRGDHRLYQGPVNVGFAETLGDGLVDANAYWANPGLSQRFFLMVLSGGDRQLSLALMSRGEHLLYVVVGEYHRQPDGDGGGPTGGLPAFLAGTEHDLADDPTGGRGSVLLHRRGRWSGELRLLDESLADTGTTEVSEEVRPGEDGRIEVATRANGFSGDAVVSYATDQIDAWSNSGNVVGSYSLSGGRALVGTIVHHTEETRCWRREVVAHDGSHKAVVHTWYRGGRRIGVAHGVLDFEPES
jgi:hypothetical protein